MQRRRDTILFLARPFRFRALLRISEPCSFHAYLSSANPLRITSMRRLSFPCHCLATRITAPPLRRISFRCHAPAYRLTSPLRFATAPRLASYLRIAAALLSGHILCHPYLCRCSSHRFCSQRRRAVSAPRESDQFNSVAHPIFGCHVYPMPLRFVCGPCRSVCALSSSGAYRH